MVFYCQRNCYEKEYDTTVCSCKPTVLVDVIGREKVTQDCFEVEFEDTVLFPEGGGQPYDKGTVNGVSVLKVLRRGGKAIHFVEKELEVGTRAHQVVDWVRRHDHMQQHSAQHLITAITNSFFDYKTISWNLGERLSYIELGTSKVTEEEFNQIEDVINEKIREAVPVSIIEYDSDDEKLKNFRTRGLPEDVVGPVRVATIENIDSTMCCGTHVKNLSDLQAIKLLYTEKGKANNTLLYFVSGARVLNYLGDCVSRERKLNTILHSNPQDHLFLIEKAKKELKETQRSLQDSFKDLAVLEAEKFNSLSPKPSVYFHHRRDATSIYLSIILSSINDDSILKVLTAGEESGPGVLVMDGPKHIIDGVSNEVCNILDGKGGGKTKFTAKVFKLSKRKEAEKYIRSFIDSQGSGK